MWRKQPQNKRFIGKIIRIRKEAKCHDLKTIVLLSSNWKRRNGLYIYIHVKQMAKCMLVKHVANME